MKIVMVSKHYVTEGKQKAADFEDLLSSQGFNAHKDKKGPRTIAEMRKEEMAKEMDPEKLKVSEPLDYPIGQRCVTRSWMSNHLCIDYLYAGHEGLNV